jgi:hypothetical protein
MPVVDGLLLKVLRSTGAQVAPRSHFGRLVDVIERRADIAEAMSAKQLLCIEPAIGLSELDVVLLG